MESFMSTHENTSASDIPMVAPKRTRAPSRTRRGIPSRGLRRLIISLAYAF